MDVTTGGLDPRQKIPLAAGYQVEFGERVRKESGLATMSVGLIADPHHAEEIVASGQADMIAIARGAMYDPRWAWHAAEELGAETEYAPKYRGCHPSLRPQLFPHRHKPA
jgi:2,4-dienoyl-CoA reductase-like NADH-dependent reductase (Old Yellow Enzyme family)